MKTLQNLINNNRRWAAAIKKSDPNFFAKLSQQQKPQYLWIGCSDSRVPSTQIVDLIPGEIFVHRNIANVVIHTDLNCLSVIQYAVEVLGVKHIIVCGHYGCGGIQAALAKRSYGLIDTWLRHIKDVYRHHQQILDDIADENEKLNRLCEFNVIEQAANVCHTSIVQKAWKAGQELMVHGWIYSIADGILKDLDVPITGASDISETYRVDWS